MAFRSAGIILVAVVSLAATGEPLVATPEDAGAIRLHIGDTGIRCVRLPCPARGIFIPKDAAAPSRQNLIFADMDGRTPLPEMIGDAGMKAAIAKAWEERGCIAIDGRPISGEDDRPVLRVDRIIGPCRGGKE